MPHFPRPNPCTSPPATYCARALCVAPGVRGRAGRPAASSKPLKTCRRLPRPFPCPLYLTQRHAIGVSGLAAHREQSQEVITPRKPLPLPYRQCPAARRSSSRNGRLTPASGGALKPRHREFRNIVNFAYKGRGVGCVEGKGVLGRSLPRKLVVRVTGPTYSWRTSRL